MKSVIETRSFEHLEMRGDGRLIKVERLHELGHIRIAPSEAREDGSSRGVPQALQRSG